jgi:hypothetical protein
MTAARDFAKRSRVGGVATVHIQRNKVCPFKTTNQNILFFLTMESDRRYERTGSWTIPPNKVSGLDDPSGDGPKGRPGLGAESTEAP